MKNTNSKIKEISIIKQISSLNINDSPRNDNFDDINRIYWSQPKKNKQYSSKLNIFKITDQENEEILISSSCNLKSKIESKDSVLNFTNYEKIAKEKEQIIYEESINIVKAINNENEDSSDEYEYYYDSDSEFSISKDKINFLKKESEILTNEKEISMVYQKILNEKILWSILYKLDKIINKEICTNKYFAKKNKTILKIENSEESTYEDANTDFSFLHGDEVIDEKFFSKKDAHNNKINEQSQSMFNSKKIPSMKVIDYIKRIDRYCTPQIHTFICMIILLERFCLKNEIIITNYNIHK